jgi:cell division protease FtsH
MGPTDAMSDSRAGRDGPRKGWRRSAMYAGLVATMLIANFWIAHRATAVHRVRVPYSPFFLRQVEAGNVRDITSIGSAVQGRFRTAVRPPRGSTVSTAFATEIPAFADTVQLSRLLQSHSVEINAEPLDKGVVWWKSLLLGFGPTLLFLLLLFALLRRGGPQAMLGAFGRARARRYQATGGDLTFADVAGIDEAKHELAEIVDFLKNPEKYERLGGRIPRGVLLSGPPGTGKTLLAKAVAGEAGAPFFSMSASEFVEAIVGIGASRVRDLFDQARKTAPAILFIDELDAVGRARGGSISGGGSDEREQTLNQILTEMDGFDSSTHVIVLAATNRPDVLDKALLRPGRFDRRVAVQAPDRSGRSQILKVHTRSVPLASDVDLEALAASTPGMVGADLANLVNEAALLAARRNHEVVVDADFREAAEKIVLGAERKIMMTDSDRRRTAYHEAGHALVAMLTAGADPVRKVSIIPRGTALGVTLSSPDIDRYNYSQDELLARIKVALGGRAAEVSVFGDPTTGAEGDIEQVTFIARRMVGSWGMSRNLGLVAVLPEATLESTVSQRTQELLDEEVRKLVEAADSEVEALIRAERTRLDALAEALLERETLDEVDAYAAANVLAPAETLPAR